MDYEIVLVSWFVCLCYFTVTVVLFTGSLEWNRDTDVSNSCALKSVLFLL